MSMKVIIEKSICNKCIKKESCQKLQRLNYNNSIRSSLPPSKYMRNGRPKELFEIIIVNCSLQDKSSPKDECNTGALYYCDTCKSMHREYSKIGIKHSKNNKEV